MATLDDWVRHVCDCLGLPVDAAAQPLVLDLAREVAHGVARPAAPLTAYLAGVAVGRGGDPGQVVAAIQDLVRVWPAAVAGEPGPL